tara:strand:+ start:27 stop:356 length:330 start_codon:yes stop_codon:yes gene_type:complete
MGENQKDADGHNYDTIKCNYKFELKRRLKMAKYTIIKNDYGSFDVKEKTRTHTGVRWMTINNYIDEFDTLEEAKNKYPKAEISDMGEEWFDNLNEKQNQIIRNKGEDIC